MVRTCWVYWGRTGTGKSRRAWDEAGVDAYPKDPRTKFWCGYFGQANVIIDEFRGGIDVAHLLRPREILRQLDYRFDFENLVLLTVEDLGSHHVAQPLGGLSPQKRKKNSFPKINEHVKSN